MVQLLEHILWWLQILLSCPASVLLLVEVLKRRGWTTRSLAVRAGLEEKTVSRIISGKVKTPHLTTIMAISNELEKAPEELGLGTAYNYRLQNAEKKQR
jgi:transcriptional regulator with XRE-family HTH domain